MWDSEHLCEIVRERCKEEGLQIRTFVFHVYGYNEASTVKKIREGKWKPRPEIAAYAFIKLGLKPPEVFDLINFLLIAHPMHRLRYLGEYLRRKEWP